MNAPLVSVIIPTFNSSDYILEAIESVLEQTYSPIEIIVIDDGSTDDTRGKLQEKIQAGQIRYVFQENRGLAAARNRGIREAAGTYLQFLDADDLIVPTKIQKQVSLLEGSPSASICGSDFRFFDESNVSNLYGGDPLEGQFPFADVRQLFTFQTVVHRWLFPASLVREAGCFEESAPNVWLMEDWLMIWKLVAMGTSILYVEEPLALYRRHPSSMTADFGKAAKGHFFALDRVEEFQKRHNLAPYPQKELDELRESYHYELGLFFLRNNHPMKAWRHFWKALVLAPNRRQNKLLLVLAIPALGSRAIDWVGAANQHLWRWRAQVRKTLAG